MCRHSPSPGRSASSGHGSGFQHGPARPSAAPAPNYSASHRNFVSRTVPPLCGVPTLACIGLTKKIRAGIAALTPPFWHDRQTIRRHRTISPGSARGDGSLAANLVSRFAIAPPTPPIHPSFSFALYKVIRLLSRAART